MGERYLLDSNTVVDYLAERLPKKGHSFVEEITNTAFNVSVISRIEVLGHESANEVLYDFLNLAETFALSDAVANQAIEIRKVKKIKLPDAIIAATALVYNFIIITRNTSDFKNIEGLEYLNPHEMK